MAKAIELTGNGADRFIVTRVCVNTPGIGTAKDPTTVALGIIAAMLEEGLLAPGPELLKFVEGQKVAARVTYGDEMGLRPDQPKQEEPERP